MSNNIRFFIDWCPVDTPILGITGDSRFDSLLQNHKVLVNNNFKKYKISDFNFTYRKDGFFIFTLSTEVEMNQSAFFELSRKISNFIKSSCLNHDHIHHDSSSGPLEAHYPVSFTPPYMEGEKEDFGDLNETQRSMILRKWLLDDSIFREIKASDRNGNPSNEFAAALLLSFFSSRFKECCSYISRIESHHINHLKEKLFFPVLFTATLIFLVTNILMFQRVSGKDLFGSLLVSASVSILFYIALNFYIQIKRYSTPIDRHLNSTIGYLSRGVSLARIVSDIYSEFDEKKVRSVSPDFSSAIESLRIISRQVDSNLEAERFKLVMALTALAAAFAFAAIK